MNWMKTVVDECGGPAGHGGDGEDDDDDDPPDQHPVYHLLNNLRRLFYKYTYIKYVVKYI